MAMLRDQSISLSDVADKLGVSRTTLYRSSPEGGRAGLAERLAQPQHAVVMTNTRASTRANAKTVGFPPSILCYFCVK